jgi:hypothetical protein
MKHITKYNKMTQDKYWKVDTIMPNFEISLDKIGVSEEYRLRLINNRYDNIKMYNYVYMVISYAEWLPKGMWSWGSDPPEISKYMGEVEVTKDDIKQWNFKNSQTKYNI